MSESIDTSLVRIHTKTGGVAGAGFLVGERHILTCAHVIARALGLPDNVIDPPSSTIKLDFPQLAPRTPLAARVISWCPVQDDGRSDIAGLELLDKPPVGAEGVRFALADQVWGHDFRALGFPNGHDNGVWATGRLLGRQGVNWIQLEDIKVPGFSIMSGFSGGPVWDTQQEGIVGMIVATSQPATMKTAFAIPFDVLMAAWPQLVSLMHPHNPYKGLEAFTERDTRYFFGRETLIDELATAVETSLAREKKEGQYARLLAVLGPSGSGKSSVMMAGLLPCLRDGGVLNSKEWVYLSSIVPGTSPFDALIVALKPHFPDTSFKTLREDLKDNGLKGLHLLATQLVEKQGDKVVLLVDQFEEMFTLTTDEAERRRFFEVLVTAVTEPHGPLFVILTLRADFYDRPMHYPELYRLIDDHHVAVLPLERDHLRRVIEQPANLPEVQLTFERGLVDELLFAMQGQSGALPLLEFTLDQLVQQCNGHQLTLQVYHKMGGVKGALSQYAEETYKKLPSDEHRQMARDVFLRLIEPGATEQDTTRRRATRSEFERADPVQTQRVWETLEAFIRARLLTTNQISGKTTIEVSHEALIREWKRLAEWLREARDDILFQQSLSEDVMEWEQRSQPKDRLYRGAQLKEAQTWAKHNRPSKQESAFLQASRRQGKLRLVAFIVVALLLISSIGIAGWFVLTLPPNPTLVTTLQDSVKGSLRYCIDNAPSKSTITFVPGLHGAIDLKGGDLVFSHGKQLTIVGPGADRLAISSSNTYAKMHLSEGAIVDISSLSFKNSETVTDAFLFNEGTLTVTNSIISNNKTTAGLISFGGGIENRGTLTVINSTVSKNSSIGDNGLGGAIYNDSTGTLIVTNSTFLGNSARGSGTAQSLGGGGSIYNDGTLTVTNSTFSNNSASNSSSPAVGGGVANQDNGTLMVTNSTFSNNSARGSDKTAGGGIYNQGRLTVTNSTLSSNSTNSSGSFAVGGGIATTGTLMVTDSIFSNNSARGRSLSAGGAIHNEGKLSVTHTTFSNNSTSSDNAVGGGIYNRDSGILTVTDSTFSNNSTSGHSKTTGGAIHNAGKLTVTDSTFSNNSINSSGSFAVGGGIATTGTLMVTDSIFSNNSARSRSLSAGGAIHNEGKLTVVSSTFSNNKANGSNSFGGGISSNTKSSSAFIRFCTIYGNTSGSSGGGIWVDPTASGQMTISSNIVAANNAQQDPDIAGVLISDGYNLIGNFSGAEGSNTSTDRQVKLADLKIDATLRNDGGPTQTLALLQGSPAIDFVPGQACSITVTDLVSGKSVMISTDQRGMPRPDGSENTCDVGAYESSY